MQINGRNIVIREYVDSDNDQCIALDESDHSISRARGWVYWSKKYVKPYHSLGEYYDDYFAIVAEDVTDPNNKTICGSVIIFISNFIYRDHAIKAGYVSALRIHAKYRRGGIAFKIMRFAEEVAKKHEVNLLYLNNVSHNEPAVKLYTKLGYEHWPKQMVLLFNNMPKTSPDSLKIGNIDFEFKEIAAEEVVKRWDNYFKDWDLRPNTWNKVLRKEEYITSYVLRSKDGEYEAGAAYVKYITNKIYYTKRYYIISEYYKKGWFNLGVSALVAGVTWGIKKLLSKFLKVDEKKSLYASSAIGLALAGTYFNLWREGRHMGLNLDQELASPQFTAVFYNGDEKLRDEVMTTLFNKMLEKAGEAKCGQVAIRMNVDIPYWNKLKFSSSIPDDTRYLWINDPDNLSQQEKLKKLYHFRL